MRRGSRRAALFPPTTWNVNDRFVNDLPRTNNSVEGWHHAFQRSIGCHHPNFWSFIEVLQLEEANQRLVLVQATAGSSRPRKRKRYEAPNTRIGNLIDN